MGLGKSLKKAARKALGGTIGGNILGLDSAPKAPVSAPTPPVESVKTKAGLAATILTGATGVEEDESQLKRKTLLGARSMLGKSL